MGEEEEEEEEEGEKCVRAFMRQLCNFFFLCRFLTFVVHTTKDFICKTCLDVYFSFVASR